MAIVQRSVNSFSKQFVVNHWRSYAGQNQAVGIESACTAH